jgi:hypothetical protein
MAGQSHPWFDEEEGVPQRAQNPLHDGRNQHRHVVEVKMMH